FRESQWCSLLAAVGLLAGNAFAPISLFIGRILLVWLLVVSAEFAIRLLGGLLLFLDVSESAAAPIDSLFRESLFSARNPISGIAHFAERSLGVSLRSTWAVSFVRHSLVPLCTLLVLLAWGMTALRIVQTHEMGIRESFGKVSGEPLLP